MKIYVDADACPVLDIVEDAAKDYELECVFVSDHNHVLYSEYCEIIQVGSGIDAADLKIMNTIDHHDILVTADYGLASLALSKDVLIMNHFGDQYTPYNINTLLAQRHLNQKLRNSNKRVKGPKKRVDDDNERFDDAFRKLIESML